MLKKIKDKIKSGLSEFLKIYSNEPSFFSKKRIESGIAFIVGEWGMIYFFLHKIDTMDRYDLFLWASVQFAIAGYVIKQIQNEKKEVSMDTTNEPMSMDESKSDDEQPMIN